MVDINIWNIIIFNVIVIVSYRKIKKEKMSVGKKMKLGESFK